MVRARARPPCAAARSPRADARRSKAYKYYERCNNLQGMSECAYMLDDYDALKRIVDVVPDGSPYLRDLGTAAPCPRTALMAALHGRGKVRLGGPVSRGRARVRKGG